AWNGVASEATDEGQPEPALPWRPRDGRSPAASLAHRSRPPASPTQTPTLPTLNQRGMTKTHLGVSGTNLPVWPHETQPAVVQLHYAATTGRRSTTVASEGNVRATSSSKYWVADINECETNNGGCADVCINKRGSYRCRCEQRGRRLAADAHSCEDVDECKRYKNKVCRHGTCYNTDGSYFCTCNAGFVPARNDSTCSGDAMCEDTCVNFPGSFSCVCTKLGHVLAPDNRSCVACSGVEYYDDSTQTCRPCPAHAHAMSGMVALSLSDCVCDVGFRGSPADMKDCKDIDECEEGSLQCSQTCTNTPGSAHCACQAGYVLLEDGITCQDIDECTEKNSTCNHLCTNLPGSYTCGCFAGGYELEKDGHTCIDIDECKRKDDNCTHECVNTPGGFTCTCPAGFYMDDDTRSCEDINECMEGDNPCPDICINTVGSFMCDCNRQGYRLAEDSSGCLDIDECENATIHGCEQVCTNLPGTFRCGCLPGYRRIGPKGCQACPQGMYRPESAIRCMRCPARSTTDGEAKGSLHDCRCEPGYQGDPGAGVTCVDVDECQTGDLRCEHKCANSVGSARCTCPRGYELQKDNVSCGDRDECASSNGGCDDVCENTVGGFECTCTKPGFKLHQNKRQCVDMNECNGTHSCQQVCVNTNGSYHCDCFPGYAMKGTQCVECPLGSFRDDATPSIKGCRDCPDNMTTQASGADSPMLCQCKAGYSVYPLSGKQCLDINECSFSNGGCDHECQNSPGSFTCACRPGYELHEDGRTCVRELSPCQVVPRKRELAWLTPGTVCSYKCKRGYKVTGDKYRTCRDNGTWSGQEAVCKAKTCHLLEPPANGYVLPKVCRTGPVPFRKRCKFRCRKGYRLRGKSGAKCLANQRWSSEGATQCVKRDKARKRNSTSTSSTSNEV
ncbi:hypothetical protein BaRGS_00008246, partial [Batillaria attramentaria]